MKKIISILISALLAASLLAGCHPDKDESSGSKPGETPPIVSEIDSLVSPPVYEDSSTEESESSSSQGDTTETESSKSTQGE